MRKGDDRKKDKNTDQKNADKFGDEVPLPGCLSEMLTSLVLPNARHAASTRPTGGPRARSAALSDTPTIPILTVFECLRLFDCDLFPRRPGWG